MSKKNTLKRVPFHKGSMLEWTSNEIDEVETPRWNDFRKELYIGYCEADEWRDNEPFRATLEYVGLEKGRSSIKAIWKDAEEHRFAMWPDVIYAVLQVGVQPGGKFTETFIVRKKGANYGIELYNE